MMPALPLGPRSRQSGAAPSHPRVWAEELQVHQVFVHILSLGGRGGGRGMGAGWPHHSPAMPSREAVLFPVLCALLRGPSCSPQLPGLLPFSPGRLGCTCCLTALRRSPAAMTAPPRAAQRSSSPAPAPVPRLLLPSSCVPPPLSRGAQAAAPHRSHRLAPPSLLLSGAPTSSSPGSPGDTDRDPEPKFN